MKKTAIAVAVAATMLSAAVQADPVTSLNVTAGGFGMEEPPNPLNNWSGTLAMGTSGILIPAAFNFNGFLGPTDIVANGTGLSGDLTGSNLTLDLSNFAIIWNGGNVGQGPNPVNATNPTVTYDGTTFTAEWSSLITGSPGGAFDGKTGNWVMQGTVNTAVPIPAAVWLFGSGVMGLAGVARRRRKAAA